MKYIITLNDRVYEVEVADGNAEVVDEYDALSAQALKPVPISRPETVREQASAPAPKTVYEQKTAPAPVPESPAGEEVISSPMPGSILDIKVAQGAAVKRGEVLLILEAMKMENEIVAPREGTVKKVFASKGAAVDRAVIRG